MEDRPGLVAEGRAGTGEGDGGGAEVRGQLLGGGRVRQREQIELAAERATAPVLNARAGAESARRSWAKGRKRSRTSAGTGRHSRRRARRNGRGARAARPASPRSSRATARATRRRESPRSGRRPRPAPADRGGNRRSRPRRASNVHGGATGAVGPSGTPAPRSRQAQGEQERERQPDQCAASAPIWVRMKANSSAVSSSAVQRPVRPPWPAPMLILSSWRLWSVRIALRRAAHLAGSQ